MWEKRRKGTEESGEEAVVVRGCGGLNLAKWVGTHACEKGGRPVGSGGGSTRKKDETAGTPGTVPTVAEQVPNQHCEVPVLRRCREAAGSSGRQTGGGQTVRFGTVHVGGVPDTYTEIV